MKRKIIATMLIGAMLISGLTVGCGKNKEKGEGKSGRRGVKKGGVHKLFHIQQGQDGGEKKIRRIERVYKIYSFSQGGFKTLN